MLSNTLWLSCINSLNWPTVLLWSIHHHSRKYLYQLRSTCEQKPMIKKQHISERKTRETKMTDLNLWCARQTRTQALQFLGKNLRLSSLPSSKTFLKTTEHSWTKTILSRGDRRKLFNSNLMNKLIRIEWMSAIRLPPKLMDVTSSMSKKKWKWQLQCITCFGNKASSGTFFVIVSDKDHR